ncbi:MAG: hypothetical protein U1F87_04595 [Kiritimatiellia bacterium]
MKTIHLVFLQLLFALLVSGCGRDPEPLQGSDKSAVLRVAYLPIIPDLPLFVAQEQGLFHKRGLIAELKKIAGGNVKFSEKPCPEAMRTWLILAYSTVLEAEVQAPGVFPYCHNVDARNISSLYAAVASPKSGIRSISISGRLSGLFRGRDVSTDQTHVGRRWH